MITMALQAQECKNSDLLEDFIDIIKIACYLEKKKKMQHWKSLLAYS